MIQSLQLTFFCYLLAASLFLAHFIRPERLFLRASVVALSVGGLGHLTALAMTALERGHLPVTNLSEAVSLLSWIMIGVYLVSQLRRSLPVMGTTVALLSSTLLLLSFYLPKSEALTSKELQVFWFPIHILFSLGGDGSLLTASIAGILYLLQEYQVKWKHLGLLFKRLPSLEVLDGLNYGCLAVGFALLTLGILSGAFWARHEWGAFWSWEPKQVFSFVTWFLYGFVLQGRVFFGWRGRRVAVLSILGLVALAVNFFGALGLDLGSHDFVGDRF